jgi:hypothetical protein
VPYLKLLVFTLGLSTVLATLAGLCVSGEVLVVPTDEVLPRSLMVVTKVPAEVLSSDGAYILYFRLEILCLILYIVESNYYRPDDVISTT